VELLYHCIFTATERFWSGSGECRCRLVVL
jgi:hypothetical protein